MLWKIIGILGLVAAIWCILDILKKNCGLIEKILLIALVLFASWIGIAIYYFILRNRF